MNRAWLLHPLLAAAGPVLFLAAHNADEVPLEDLPLVLAAAEGIAVVLFAVAFGLLRDTRKAAALATLSVGVFFSYGHVFDLAWEKKWLATSHTIELALYGASAFVVGLGALVLWRARATLENFTRVLTVFTAAMLVSSVYELGKEAAEQLGKGTRPAPARATAPILEDREDLPDIYHIILDGYARTDTLREFYGHDNGAFVDALRERGFYVAEESRSNYIMTHACIASVLNMKYIDDVAERAGKSRRPFYRLMKSNQVGHHLKDKGYRYVHFDTNYGGTESSAVADIRYNFRPAWMRSEFMTVLLRTTLLRSMEPSAAQAIRAMAAQVTEVPRLAGPTFTFLHLLIPHNPYVFDRDGNERADIPGTLMFKEKTGGWGEKAEYVDQLVYTSRLALEIIDGIRANSTHPPVIILQSDHGSSSTYRTKARPEQRERFFRERTGILNAWSAPASVTSLLTPDTSPVNTYRIVFAGLFGEPLELLPHRTMTWWYSKYIQPRDITEQLDAYDHPERVSPAPPPDRSSARETSP